jgi:hypothetical protein
MIHPDTHIHYLGAEIGHGVFATRPIPCGSIVYVQDALDIVITQHDSRLEDPRCTNTIARFSYLDENGNRVISWDVGRYVNHCCQANTLSTGWGFELAVRDIAAGEQITDDYRLYNYALSNPAAMGEMHCPYGFSACARSLALTDPEQLIREWDAILQGALTSLATVAQPLWPYLPDHVRADLHIGRYRSVREVIPL